MSGAEECLPNEIAEKKNSSEKENEVDLADDFDVDGVVDDELEDGDDEDPTEELDLGDLDATEISSSSSLASDVQHIESDDDVETSSDNDKQIDTEQVGEENSRGKVDLSTPAVATERHNAVVSSTSSEGPATSAKPPRPISVPVPEAPRGFVPRRNRSRVLSSRTFRGSVPGSEARPSRIYGSGLSTTNSRTQTVPPPAPFSTTSTEQIRQAVPQAKKSGGNKGTLGKKVWRASATFYNIASAGLRGQKHKKSKSTVEGKVSRDAGRNGRLSNWSGQQHGSTDASATVGEQLSAEKKDEIDSSHKVVIDRIDDELRTLKRVADKSINIEVCKSVTQGTINILKSTCLDLVSEYELLEDRVNQLVQEVKTVDNETYEEVKNGERELILAKLQLAESQGALLDGRLKLRKLQEDAETAVKTKKLTELKREELRKKKDGNRQKRKDNDKLETHVNTLEGDW